MKQTLTLKLGQSLTMTPQLQQAIRLLQLSALDLQQEIQETLEENPLLEMGEESPESSPEETSLREEINSEISASSDALAPDEAQRNDTDLTAQDSSLDSLDGGDEPSITQVNDQLSEPVAEDMPVDSSWDDIYPNGSSLPAGDSDYDPMSNRSADENLTDHLLWQLNLTPFAASDRTIALSIIDAIDANGMLTVSTEDIWESLYEPELAEVDRITHADVCAVLSRVQEFDPLGVGARDLRECLNLQLSQMKSNTPWLPEAQLLLDEHLDLLASKDFTALKRKTKFSDETLANAMTLIRSLNPRPGASVASEAPEYIIPDVVVRKFEGKWIVELNGEATPQLRINSLYEGYARTSKNSNDKAYLKDRLQEARWFLKSLQTRHDTLLRVASKIVEVQRGFLEYGPEAMKPLILADIAEAVDLHESTISRVTSRKYMATPRGVFELKYFFSSHVTTANGGEVSSTAIRALIKKLTAEENPKKPLSDSKIAAILKDQNIKVARRTVAKYRESLSIPPSNERKQLV